MSERSRLLLRPRIVLDPHPNQRAAAYGVKQGFWKPCDGQLVELTVTAPAGKHVDALLSWRVRVSEQRLPNGNFVKVDDVSLAQIVGATDVESAIRAVEEAAVIAGWARLEP